MGRKPKTNDTIVVTEFVPKDKRAKVIKRTKDALEESMLSRVLSSDTLAQKIEAIRSINPYFYLLTDMPTAVTRPTERKNDDPTN